MIFPRQKKWGLKPVCMARIFVTVTLYNVTRDRFLMLWIQGSDRADSYHLSFPISCYVLNSYEGSVFIDSIVFCSGSFQKLERRIYSPLFHGIIPRGSGFLSGGIYFAETIDSEN